ncbi:unnamed protein product [Ceutorhynchus assimilis]|uniref:rRNA biogenesis protein RRP36 n=1 Tax=Ceutorhynchus assimilis TaxID=467358 RepID=A0A9N9MF06_9CUCU|nr:unnamed protein product [Ceutorhynchus assimilis]
MSDTEDFQRQQIRDNLSTLSFEELIKLKEKVGSKVYNATVHGAPSTSTNKKEIKRQNKNRPREISSKIRMKQVKSILTRNSTTTIKSSARDPRFDPSCGEFDKETFKQNYEFVNELRQKEKLALQKELNEVKDPERKKTIKLLIQRTENKVREEEKTNKAKARDYAEKRQIRETIKQGEKPVYIKKSVKKLQGLVEKYEELKKSNRLEKHIQKRAKKLKVKDRRQMEKIK